VVTIDRPRQRMLRSRFDKLDHSARLIGCDTGQERGLCGEPETNRGH
jgi:hypothetical protein